MAENRIPKRNEVKKENTWATEDLFPTDQAWTEEYEALKSVPARANAVRGTLGRSAAQLLAYFKEQDEIELRLTRLFNYASRKGDEDMGNSFYQDLRSKAGSLAVAVESAFAFAVPELLAIPDETLERFFQEAPAKRGLSSSEMYSGAPVSRSWGRPLAV